MNCDGLYYLWGEDDDLFIVGYKDVGFSNKYKEMFYVHLTVSLIVQFVGIWFNSDLSRKASRKIGYIYILTGKRFGTSPFTVSFEGGL